MKKSLTMACVLCLAAAGLSGCETTESYDANANFATGRTAGEVDMEPMYKPRQERTFRRVQSK